MGLLKFRRYEKFAPVGTLLERLAAWQREEWRVVDLHYTYFDQRDWDALRDVAAELLFEIYTTGLDGLSDELTAEVAKWRSHRLCTLSERSWSNDWAVILTRKIAEAMCAPATEEVAA